LNRDASFYHHFNQLWFQTMLNCLVRIVLHFVTHCHPLRLNQIHTWHELNRMHFMKHHFNQSWFQTMLKFLDQNVFHLVNHFHQLHLNQIHT
jgi:hypothetical protein